MQRLQTFLLFLSWHLLWAPARGALIPLRGTAAWHDDRNGASSRAKVEPAALMWPLTQLSASTAAATAAVSSKGLGLGQKLSASRRLLQPPGLPPAARDITIQELLANIDVSADAGGVRVALPPVPPPKRSSGSNSTADNKPDDRGLPPVAVNVKLSDLFPPEPSGRKLLSSSSTTTTSATSSSSTKDAGSNRHLTATLLQAAGAATGLASSSNSGAADTGLSAYMRSNPTVAPALQELTGGRRNPSISDSSGAKSVKLCDLFTDSLCTAAGAKRKLLRGHLGRFMMFGQRMQQIAQVQQLNAAASSHVAELSTAAAAQNVRATARRSLQQRDTLTTSQVNGLASWARQAPDSDVQYVQAIVGGGFISRAQATPQLTIDQVVGPQQASNGVGGRRKAARKLMLLLPPVVGTQGSAGSSRSSSMVSSSGRRTLLNGDAGADTGTGTGTAAAAEGGMGAASAAAAGGSAAEQAGTSGSNAAGASAGAGEGAGAASAQPDVTAASGSSLGLQEWAARGASPQDVQAVEAIGGKQVLAPTSRLSAENVKLDDVGRH